MKNITQNKLMDESEIKELVKSLLRESGYANYAIDGFLFLFKTFSEMAEKNNVGFIDLCSNLQRFIYIESIHCDLMQSQYQASIHERYRKTNYENDTDVYREMQKEIQDGRMLNVSAPG